MVRSEFDHGIEPRAERRGTQFVELKRVVCLDTHNTSSMHRLVRTAVRTIARAALAIGVATVVVLGLTRGGRRGTGGPAPSPSPEERLAQVPAQIAQARAVHREEQRRIREINGLIHHRNSIMGVPSQGDAYGHYNRRGVFEMDAELSPRGECEDCAAVKYGIARDTSHLSIAGPTGIDDGPTSVK